MFVIIITGVVVLAACVGMVFLQIYLSKMVSRWPGLILPVICFFLSWIAPLEIMSTGDVWHDILLIVLSLLLANIFTIILLVIYAVMRNRRRKEEQLKKMNIQDLE